MRQTAGLLAALLYLAPVTAQTPARLTTLDALRQFPSYYHLQPVIIRGTVARTAGRVTLRTEAHELRLLLTADTNTPDGPAETRGLFVDVGKLDRTDPRLTGYDREAADTWPKPGEELLLRVLDRPPDGRPGHLPRPRSRPVVRQQPHAAGRGLRHRIDGRQPRCAADGRL